MKANEPGVIDAFNDFMRDIAQQEGIAYAPFAMGSADTQFADYLCSAGTRFALFEFKDTDAGLRSEGEKAKRLLLCRALEKQLAMVDLHDRGHFASWAGRSDGELWVNIYRHEICNCRVFGAESLLSKQHPNENERVGAETFARSFFAKISRRGLTHDALLQYVRWVCQVQGGTEAVSLVMRNAGKASIRRFDFSELQEVLGQLPGPPPPRGHRSVPGASKGPK